MGFFIIIVLTLVGLSLYKFFKSYMSLKRALEYQNYDLLFDFLNPIVKKRNISGKIIHTDSFTQIICRNVNGVYFELQVNWDKKLMKVKHELITPLIPFFVLKLNDTYRKYDVTNDSWLRNIIDSVLEDVDERLIIK